MHFLQTVINNAENVFVYPQKYYILQEINRYILVRLIVKGPVLIIDKPNFVVKLHEDVIEVDLKTGARKDFED